MSKTVWIFIIVVLLLIGGIVFWWWPRPEPLSLSQSDEVVAVTDYRCSEGKTITSTFLAVGMKLELSDGRTFTLAPAPAASGARYANETGSVIFWAKQYSAFLEELGKTTYQGCLVHPLPFSKDTR